MAARLVVQVERALSFSSPTLATSARWPRIRRSALSSTGTVNIGDQSQSKTKGHRQLKSQSNACKWENHLTAKDAPPAEAGKVVLLLANADTDGDIGTLPDTAGDIAAEPRRLKQRDKDRHAAPQLYPLMAFMFAYSFGASANRGQKSRHQNLAPSGSSDPGPGRSFPHSAAQSGAHQNQFWRPLLSDGF